VQSFVCPDCGHGSTFDPRLGPARCPQCGFTPPTDERRDDYLHEMRRQRYQPFLTELVSHWEGTHTPDLEFSLPTFAETERFYRAYRRALGADLYPQPGRGQIQMFATGYLHLRRGEREKAAHHFRLLASLAPGFADAPVWLAATTGDPAARLGFLETALRLEPDHPLALDAKAIALSQVTSPNAETGDAPGLVHCPQCGTSAPCEPKAMEVVCAHCGLRLDLPQAELLDEGALPPSQQPLLRSVESQAWTEVQRIAHCLACGTKLTQCQRLAERCALCGSASVVSEHAPPGLEQPDGFAAFELDEQQALDAIRALQQPGLRGLQAWWLAWSSQEPGFRYFPVRLPDTLRNLRTWWDGRRCQVASIVGIYLPFRMFDGVVEVRWPAGGDAVPPESVQDTQVRGVLISAAETPTHGLLERLYRFDLEVVRPFEPGLLADWPVRLENQNVEAAVARAQRFMLGLVRLQIDTSRIPGSERTVRSGRFLPRDPPALRVCETTGRLVLLPVWAVQMERRGQRLLALVNGQTGKVVLGYPLPHGSG
jgi:hypothetical protein